jgi:hypothetical protein
VSAPPNYPVSAQPVSAHPVSGHPAAGHPVSGPAYPAPAYPAPAYQPAQYRGGAAAPPPMRPAAGSGRTGIIAASVALAAVVVVAAIVLVVVLLPDGGSDDPPAGDRTVTVNRTLYSSGGQSVTLTSIAVTGGKLRVNMRYENRASTAWQLACPAAATDLRSSWVTVAGRQVYPDDSWCVQTHPGQGVTIDAGDGVDSWGQYPVVPEQGVSFSLNWYDLPAVTGLTF